MLGLGLGVAVTAGCATPNTLPGQSKVVAGPASAASERSADQLLFGSAGVADAVRYTTEVGVSDVVGEPGAQQVAAEVSEELVRRGTPAVADGALGSAATAILAGLGAWRNVRAGGERQSKVSDYLGSHWCVRLAEDEARSLFAWASVGTPVEIK